jgi:hypothetical protein
MIKKFTKVFLDGLTDSRFESLGGGMPLSKGETVHFKEKGKTIDYFVAEKKTEIEFVGEELNVATTYWLKKKV